MAFARGIKTATVGIASTTTDKFRGLQDYLPHPLLTCLWLSVVIINGHNLLSSTSSIAQRPSWRLGYGSKPILRLGPFDIRLSHTYINYKGKEHILFTKWNSACSFFLIVVAVSCDHIASCQLIFYAFVLAFSSSSLLRNHHQYLISFYFCLIVACL